MPSKVLQEFCRYYWLSTTVSKSYLQPILARYIAQLDHRLSGAGIATRRKYVMQSNGGMATFSAAARRAVSTGLSGPAGGVTAGGAPPPPERPGGGPTSPHGRGCFGAA